MHFIALGIKKIKITIFLAETMKLIKNANARVRGAPWRLQVDITLKRIIGQ